MNGTMTIITANGDVTEIPYSKPVPCDHLRKAVGGWLETIPYFYKYEGKDCVAMCDEEGKMKRLPHNKKADALWKEQVSINDHLVGDIVILQGDIAFMRAL